MHSPIRPLLFAVPPILVLLPAAAAGPLPRERLPADAAWVMHADLEQAVSTRLGRFFTTSVWEELGETPIGELGIEAGADLQDLTLFGWADEEAGTVVMASLADGADRLLDHIKAQQGYERLEHEGGTIHSWLESGAACEVRERGGAAGAAPAVELGVRVAERGDEVRVYALDRAAAGGRLMAASDRMDALLSLARVLENEAPSRAEATEARLPVETPPGSFLFFAATDPRPFGQEPAAQVAKLAEVVKLSAGELDGEGFFNLSVSARTEQEASQIAQVLQGLSALGLMMISADDPDLAWVRQLAGCVTFEADKLHVSATCRFDPQVVIDCYARAQRKDPEEAAPVEQEDDLEDEAAP